VVFCCVCGVVQYMWIAGRVIELIDSVFVSEFSFVFVLIVGGNVVCHVIVQVVLHGIG